MASSPTIEHRFFAKVQCEPMTGCWLWTGAISGSGYSVFKDSGIDKSGHRFAYEYFKADVPAGLVLDHSCDTPSCVNPDHLKACTQRENVLRSAGLAAINARKTHCVRGHELNEQNLRASNPGIRACKECHRLREAERRRAKRGTLH
jgi:hypothetical protein